MTPEERVLRGNEARYILDHEVFRDAFKQIEDSIISQMREVKPRDKEMHTELIRRYQTLQAFKRAFVQTMETGKLADKEIKSRKPRVLQAVEGLLRR
jgi:hypothetical protein